MALHPHTDKLVDEFAAALKAKLERAETKYGYSNEWSRDDWADRCRKDLAEHVEKGDPLDVAAYAAFCWFHGWSTSQDAHTQETRRRRYTLDELLVGAERLPELYEGTAGALDGAPVGRENL